MKPDTHNQTIGLRHSRPASVHHQPLYAGAIGLDLRFQIQPPGTDPGAHRCRNPLRSPIGGLCRQMQGLVVICGRRCRCRQCRQQHRRRLGQRGHLWHLCRSAGTEYRSISYKYSLTGRTNGSETNQFSFIICLIILGDLGNRNRISMVMDCGIGLEEYRREWRQRTSSFPDCRQLFVSIP